MTPHLLRHNPHPCQPFRRSHRRASQKWFLLLLLPAAGLALACASCSESPSPKPPPVPVTDTRPVGEGIKLLGFAVIGAAVVTVLGRLIR